jgi:2-hydroxy-6-oxonona-2,4-dienedioate hydrolase
VVLVHGMVVSGRYMAPLLEELASSYQVFVPDLPGFGRSEKPSWVLDVAGLAEALEGFLEAAGIERAALVGNSMGCQVIADLAARRPEHVERVVLQGPTVDPWARTVPRQVWRFFVNGLREPPALAPITVRDYLSAGPGRALATFRHTMEDRIEEKLPGVRVPALVVWGDRDAIVSRRWAEEAARLLPEGRLAVISGAAHTANYSAPTEFARVVRDFLEER